MNFDSALDRPTLAPTATLRVRVPKSMASDDAALQEPVQVEAPQTRIRPVAARISLATTLLIAPLAFGAVEPWGWSAMVCVVMLTLVLWMASWVRRGSVELTWSPLYVPGALFLLLGLYQYFSHRTADSVSTRNALIELAALLILFFLVLQIAVGMDLRTQRRVGLGIVGYTFAVALLAVVQYFSSPGKLYWQVTPRAQGWIFGPYLNHNHYAGLMEMLIALSAGHALSDWRRARSALIGFAVLFPVASVLLSGSRGGMMALLVETGLLVAILLLKGRRVRAGWLAMRITAATICAFVAFLWMDTGDVLTHLETVFEPAHAMDVSFAYRLQTARDSLRMLRNHWSLGTGLGSFQYAFPRYQSLPGDEVWDHAHDDFVELLGETGVVGGLLVLAAAILWFRLAFRNVEDRLRRGTGWIQLGAAVGCCGLLLHSFFDFNLHIPANALWFAACAALATADIPVATRLRA